METFLVGALSPLGKTWMQLLVREVRNFLLLILSQTYNMQDITGWYLHQSFLVLRQSGSARQKRVALIVF
jgi:hypothetical protein